MSHPYGAFLHKVSKPSRYIGGEHNEIRKAPGEADVEICLAFPDLYDIGMSHLGTKILYRLLNRHPRIACERAFAPWPDMEAELRARELPLLSLESHRALREFDVVGISLQYEMTYTNVLTLLDLGGIPLRATDRSDDDPLVLGGGPTATHPEPVAPFFDLFFVGEAEGSLPRILLDYRKLVDEGLPREERLRFIAGEHRGLYAPSLYETAEEPATGTLVVGPPRREGVPERIERAMVADLAAHPFPDDFPVPRAEAVFDRMSIEIARGCTEGCRFCQAGMIYRPVRERAPREVIKTVQSAIEKGGFDEVSLTSLSTADYSPIAPLVHEMIGGLRNQRVSLSVSSLRAYGLDKAVLDDIRSIRATGLTFAPEAGTQRMRDVVNKNISDDDLLETARRVFSRGWKRAKLYFMIGLPTETDDDVFGIVETAAAMRAEGRRTLGAGKVDVTISVSSHVPKPHTPFQWAAFDPPEEIERKQRLLRDAARAEHLQVKHHDPRTSFLEAIAARGDRRVADTIQRAWELGCRFDGWTEHLLFDLWERAIEETNLPLHRYLGTLPTDARLPWDHIDVGLEPGFLVKEYRKSLRGRLSLPCGKPAHAQMHHSNAAEHLADARKLVCYDCGVVCDLERMRDERLDYLHSMGALEPRKIETPPPAREETVPEEDAPKRKRKKLPPVVVQPEGRRYRLRYSKLGAERFQGHLDTLRALPRVFRRAGIPVNYSQGFHPHPLLSFGPALPLGTSALGELVDVTLGVEIAEEDLRDRFNDVAAPGLRIEQARRLSARDRKLYQALATADYLVVLEREAALEAAGGFERLESLCAELSAAATLPIVRRDKKGREKTKNLAELIMRIGTEAPRAPDPRLAPDPEGLAIALHLRIDQGWLARPQEVLELLDLGALEPLELVRLGCWAEAEGRRADPITGVRFDGSEEGEGLRGIGP